MRYRLLLPEWAEQDDVPSVIEADDLSMAELKKKNDAGWGIYYFPNYNRHKKTVGFLCGKNIDVWNVVYVDMDLKDGIYKTKDEFIEKLISFDLPPNWTVDSGNGIHAYWKIADLDINKFVTLQLQLINKFSTDRSIWTVLRIMRLEGFYNTKKKDEPKSTLRVDLLDTVYTFDELSSRLEPLEDADNLKMLSHIRKVQGLDPIIIDTELDVSVLPESFERFMAINERAASIMSDYSGDRSKNAFSLAHILADAGFNKQEAIVVIANTPKYINRADRETWATDCIEKVYAQKVKYTVPSVADRIKQYKKSPPRMGSEVGGPNYMDVNVRRWRTGQVLGIVGGTGVGKSTITLDIFKHMILNNPESNDIYLYFNLEMSDYDVIDRWQVLIKNKQGDLSKRLYVISNEDDTGNPKHMSLQHIYWYCKDLEKVTGHKIAAIAIDHISVINPAIDVSKQPDFGMVAEMEGAFGNMRSVSNRKMPQLLKELAKQLDTFLLIQSQTSKANGAHGELPLGVGAAFGASQFEHFIDYLITICQPIRRVYHKTDLRILGWQYAKNRHAAKGDVVTPYSMRVLKVDLDTGGLSQLDPDETEEVKRLNIECENLRKGEEKKKGVEIINSPGGELGKLKEILKLKIV